MSEEEVKNFRSDLDTMADFHARLSDLESRRVKESKRVTALEEKLRGQYSGDDPSKYITGFILVMVALQVLPLITEAVAKWRSSRLQQ